MRLSVSDREFHTILAALRYYRVLCDTDNRPQWMQDLASNEGEVKPLDSLEIDELCERLNVAPSRRT